MDDRITTVAGLVVGAPFIVCGLWLFLHADPKLKTRGSLLTAVGYAVLGLMNVLEHRPLAAAVNAALAAIYLYWWWNNGGGDGMKRRLTSWASAFGPKLAPQSA